MCDRSRTNALRTSSLHTHWSDPPPIPAEAPQPCPGAGESTGCRNRICRARDFTLCVLCAAMTFRSGLKAVTEQGNGTAHRMIRIAWSRSRGTQPRCAQHAFPPHFQDGNIPVRKSSRRSERACQTCKHVIADAPLNTASPTLLPRHPMLAIVRLIRLNYCGGAETNRA